MESLTTLKPQIQNRVTLWIIATLFLFSGASSLIYEIVWVRLFSYTFGASAIALSVVLSAFMGGLAVGGAIGGRFADRIRRPLLAYALCEVAIVLSAFLLPTAISSAEFVERALYLNDLHDGWLLPTVRFGLAFLSLLVPTALMGATFPILSGFAVSTTSHLGKRVGGLSAANTGGAVAGVCLAGFVLLPNLGISRTILVAVALNVVAAVGAVWLHWKRVGSGRHRIVDAASVIENDATASNAEATAVDWSRSGIVLVLFVSGMAALACEYLWTRSLLFSFDRLKNTTYNFTCVLAVFLTGLAAGNILAARLVDRAGDHRRCLGWLFVLLGTSITASAACLYWLEPVHNVIDPVTLRLDMFRSLSGMLWRTTVILGLPTLLMGMIFPFAVRSVATHRNVGQWVGRLYAWNTAGAVLGAVVAAYLIIPGIGIGRGIVVTGLVEALVGWVILRPRWLSIPGAIGTTAAIVGVFWIAPEQWSLQTLNEGDTLVGYNENAAATVAVIEDSTGSRRICIDDVAVAGTSRVMQTDQKGLAHVPMLLHPDPARALTVGFGSGGASYSFLLHRQAMHVDCLEICPAVVQFAPLLEAANHGFMERRDPRYRVILEDARAYLKYSDDKYDLIVTDCTDLRYRASANLYDYEFFELCREHTTEDGLTVVWMPLGGLSNEMFRLTIRTFLRVYPETSVFYLHNEWTHFVLLVGSRDPLSIDFPVLKRRIAQLELQQDLEEIGLGDPAKLVATYVTGGEGLADFVGDGEINTEERPVLEFQVPRHETGPWSAQRNLDALCRYRQSVMPSLSSGTSTEDSARIDRYQQAAVHIVDAQAAERRVDIDGATQGYLRALEITPDDPAVSAALEFEWLQLLAEQGNPTAHLLLGRVAQLQGDHPDALDHFGQYGELLAALRERPTRRTNGMISQANAWLATAQEWRATSETAIRRQTRENDR